MGSSTGVTARSSTAVRLRRHANSRVASAFVQLVTVRSGRVMKVSDCEGGGGKCQPGPLHGTSNPIQNLENSSQTALDRGAQFRVLKPGSRYKSGRSRRFDARSAIGKGRLLKT
jgi:hypothetical protein